MTAISFRAGTTLGPYEIEQQLRQSGPLTVYRGVDTRLRRAVAISVLDPPEAPADVAAFQREARLLARIRHPHLARTYAGGVVDGAPYLVQELLTGPSLAQRLADLAAQGAVLPRDEALALISQIAAALDAAHARGLRHGGLRPEAVLFDAAGQAVLGGFLLGPAAGDGAAYLAPEQALGDQPLTTAADVYALGVLAFQIITGRLPFGAGQPGDLRFQQIYAAPPRPSGLRPDLPLALDRALLSALVKEPAARPARAGALADLLARTWAGGPKAYGGPEGGRAGGRRSVAELLTILALVLTLSLLAIFGRDAGVPWQPERTARPAPIGSLLAADD